MEVHVACPSPYCVAKGSKQRPATEQEIATLPEAAAAENITCCTYCRCLYARRWDGTVRIWEP